MAETQSLPVDFATEFRPHMPGQGLGPRADAALRQLAMYGFVAAPGLFVEQAPHMIKAAHSPEIADHCPNDPKKRVGNVRIMADWVSGGRDVGNLYHTNEWSGEPLTTQDIAALTIHDVTQDTLMWRSESKPGTTERGVTGALWTTAYRTFPAAKKVLGERVPRDVRLRLGMLGAVILVSDFVRRGANATDLSLAANLSNEAALSMYRELGFVEIEEAREPYTRPTVQLPSATVNGHVVRQQKGGQEQDIPGAYEVDDVRTYWRLSGWEL